MGLNPTVDTFRFWHTAELQSHKILESLTLRQMSITDDDLKTILTDYPKLNALTLISCTGFSLKGIEAVAANCRNLVRLIVRSCTVSVSDSKGDLLTTLHAESLVSLEMPGIKGVNSNIGDPGRLYKIIKSAARLEHLGGVVNMKGQQPSTKAYEDLSSQLKESRKLESLSLGRLEGCLLPVPSCYIHAFQPIAAQLISLNIRNFKSARKEDQAGLIKNCINLRTLQACSFEMDDVGLETIGRCCTKLVRVKLLDRLDRSGLTEKGLKILAIGCPLLKSLSICVQRMTCECLAFFSQHKKNVESFKLYVEDMSFYMRTNADILDQGFASLLGVCQKLKKLRASNVSNELFSSIAGKNLEVLIVSVADAAGGKTPNLRGLARSCPRLEKLGIQGCWFPSLPRDVFLKKAFKCMWLKSYGGCTNLGECRKGLTDWPDVNLHVVRSMGQHNLAKVILLYIYKTRVPGKAFFP